MDPAFSVGFEIIVVLSYVTTPLCLQTDLTLTLESAHTHTQKNTPTNEGIETLQIKVICHCKIQQKMRGEKILDKGI